MSQENKVRQKLAEEIEYLAYQEKTDSYTKQFASENEALQYLADVTGKSIKIANVDQEFVDAYIEAMLWSSTDKSDERGGEPLDKNYDKKDIAPEFMQQIRKDCEEFMKENDSFIESDEVEKAGHDFWLTRNGHGAGFWDGDWDFFVDGKNAGEHLTDAAKKFGEVYPYVGDDGQIYGQ